MPNPALVVAVAFALAGCSSSRLPEQAPIPAAPTKTDVADAARSAWLHLGRHGTAPPDSWAVARAPAGQVFLSLATGQPRPKVIQGRGALLKDALSDALRATPDALEPVALRVELPLAAVEAQPILTKDDLRVWGGLLGVQLEPGGFALLPDEIIARHLLAQDGSIQRDRLRRFVARQPERFRGIDVERVEVAQVFSVRAAYSGPAGAFTLQRGHRTFDELTPELLLDAAQSAGDYLTRMTGSDGRFVYSYSPKGNVKQSTYNILRHAGTIYAMLELHERNGDPAILDAAERALRFLRASIAACPPPQEEHPCVIENQATKLGGNALTTLALSKYAAVTGNVDSLDLAHRLARAMVATQRESGEFYPHKRWLPDGRPDDLVSMYYPGEALFALARLARLDPGGPWLDAAHRGALFLIEIRDANVATGDLPHDHWLLYALDEIYRATRDPRLLDQAMRIARTIVDAQNRDPQITDWRGSFYRPPRSTPTATRMEGLLAAYALARDFGSEHDQREIREAIGLGVRFFLQLQLRPESGLHLPRPGLAMGGFKRSFTNWEIRIDYVQHAISALLAAEHVLSLEEAEAQAEE